MEQTGDPFSQRVCDTLHKHINDEHIDLKTSVRELVGQIGEMRKDSRGMMIIVLGCLVTLVANLILKTI